MMRIIYFVHGTTTDNEKGIATGWNPGELSELGKKQSTELCELVKDKRFDAIYCSDLKRAVDSARLAFGDKIMQDKRLRECDYGKLTGTSFDKIESRLSKYIDKPFPDGESLKDVENRMLEFLEEISKKHQNGTVAIAAHQAPQLALEVITKGKTWEQAIHEDWRKRKAWQPGWDYEYKG